MSIILNSVWGLVGTVVYTDSYISHGIVWSLRQKELIFCFSGTFLEKKPCEGNDIFWHLIFFNKIKFDGNNGHDSLNKNFEAGMKNECASAWETEDLFFLALYNHTRAWHPCQFFKVKLCMVFTKTLEWPMLVRLYSLHGLQPYKPCVLCEMAFSCWVSITEIHVLLCWQLTDIRNLIFITVTLRECFFDNIVYIIHYRKYFIDEPALKVHFKGKPHKRR